MDPGRLSTPACLVLAACVAACSPIPPVPYSQPPSIGVDYPDKLGVDEPAVGELVVIVNSNLKMTHAGLFAGSKLLDPAGSYLGVRRQQATWAGSSLQDYLRFQLEDGPEVKLYRFHLPAEAFVQIKSRMELAGSTAPLFCAAKVQNILSGVPPFEALPSAWFVTPAAVSRHLDALIKEDASLGRYYWPDGSSCYAPPQPWP